MPAVCSAKLGRAFGLFNDGLRTDMARFLLERGENQVADFAVRFFEGDILLVVFGEVTLETAL